MFYIVETKRQLNEFNKKGYKEAYIEVIPYSDKTHPTVTNVSLVYIRPFEATKGYILNELQDGPCIEYHFLKDTSTKDYDAMMAALQALLANDVILRRGTVFYTPKAGRDNVSPVIKN